MKKEYAVLALLRQALFGGPAAKIDGVDWDEMLRECEQQHVVSLVYGCARQQDMPSEAASKWKTAMDRLLVYNAASQRRHLEVYKKMEEAGIPCVIIKGIASAAYYPVPLLRSAGDVDFLVRKEDIARGDALLREMGLFPQKGAEQHDSHLAYHKRGCSVEMHWRISGVPLGAEGDAVQEELKDLMDSAVPYTCESGTCRVPSVRHHAIILLVHTANHIMTSGTSLRHLCDWAAFAGKAGADTFEKELRAPLKRCGLWRLAQILTDLSTAYLGLPVQRWAGVTEQEYRERFLEEFFASGYFGAKDRARKYESFWYTRKETRKAAEGSMLRSFAGRMNEIVTRTWPVTRRLPFLIPFGWIWLSGRYAIRMLKGKRPKIRFGSMLSAARDRRDFYCTWHLFEKED